MSNQPIGTEIVVKDMGNLEKVIVSDYNRYQKATKRARSKHKKRQSNGFSVGYDPRGYGKVFYASESGYFTITLEGDHRESWKEQDLVYQLLRFAIIESKAGDITSSFIESVSGFPFEEVARRHNIRGNIQEAMVEMETGEMRKEDYKKFYDAARELFRISNASQVADSLDRVLFPQYEDIPVQYTVIGNVDVGVQTGTLTNRDNGSNEKKGVLGRLVRGALQFLPWYGKDETRSNECLPAVRGTSLSAPLQHDIASYGDQNIIRELFQALQGKDFRASIARLALDTTNRSGGYFDRENGIRIVPVDLEEADFGPKVPSVFAENTLYMIKYAPTHGIYNTFFSNISGLFQGSQDNPQGVEITVLATKDTNVKFNVTFYGYDAEHGEVKFDMGNYEGDSSQISLNCFYVQTDRESAIAETLRKLHEMKDTEHPVWDRLSLTIPTQPIKRGCSASHVYSFKRGINKMSRNEELYIPGIECGGFSDCFILADLFNKTNKFTPGNGLFAYNQEHSGGSGYIVTGRLNKADFPVLAEAIVDLPRVKTSFSAEINRVCVSDTKVHKKELGKMVDQYISGISK